MSSRPLRALRFAALVLFLAALVPASFYLKAWVQDPAPAALDAAWSETSIGLGEGTTLETTVRLPWHRELAGAPVPSPPEGLVAITGAATATPGPFQVHGVRDWSVIVPLVAVDDSLEESAALTIPVEARGSHRRTVAAVPLPALEISMPEARTEDLATEMGPLAELAEPEPETGPGARSSFALPWGQLALLLLGCIALVHVMGRLLRRHERPAWKRALDRLERLERGPRIPTPQYWARLMDILKGYADERFELRATTRTDTELLAALGELPDLDDSTGSRMAWLANTSRSARFAGREVPEEERRAAGQALRVFIERTTPEDSDG